MGLLLLLLLAACSAGGDRAATPTLEAAAIVPPAGGPAPAAQPAAQPTVQPTAQPTPRPTPVPLPESCLLPAFAGDEAVCETTSHYAIQLEVDPTSARVTGQQQVRYVNSEDVPLDVLYLRLFPNTPAYGGAMRVSNLQVDGRPLSPTRELQGSALRLALETPLEPGQAAELRMDFSIDVPTNAATGHGLFSYVRGVMALPSAYPLIPVYDDEGWNVEIAPVYGDDVYSDVAAYDVEIRAPAELTLIASGSCTQPEAGLWRCEAAPMRNFVLVLGKGYEREAREVEGVVVNSYFYGHHRAGGERALEVAAEALAAYTRLFGPYPYAELDVVETPNYLGGMEYPGLVVIEDRLYPGVAGVEWLTAHEVAHQWWFAVVGSDQVDEPWLDEALTQYSTMLYYEQVYGPQRAEAVRNAEFVQVHQSLIRRGLDLPIGLPVREYSRSLYWQVVYDKGALYFHTLRETVGDEDFFAILRTYYERNRYQIATPESWLQAVEAVTGDRQMALYEEWVLP